MDQNITIGTLTFLHVTDCHLSATETVQIIDQKTRVGGVKQPLRSKVLQDALHKLADSYSQKNKTIDGVLFSGDGTLKGDPNGQIALRKMLLAELSCIGVTNGNIIATPGNHDIVACSEPGSPQRYKLFQEAWLGSDPVIVPFLDGIHDIEDIKVSSHVLKDPLGNWAVFPINTANWSQLRISDKDDPEIAKLRTFIKTKGDTGHISTLERLCSYDIARVSENQLEALRMMVKDAGDVRLRIAVLHHHLLPVDGREEFKAFADITNLGQLRQVLRDLGFNVVVHGHKHATAAYYDHIYPDGVAEQIAHRVLTVSGGTYGPTGQHPDTPLQLVRIEGIPHAPRCTIDSLSSAPAGRGQKTTTSPTYRLWEDDPRACGPVTIFGKSIDDVYVRAIQTIKEGPNRPIICTIDFPPEDNQLPFPKDYPRDGTEEERREWFEETVQWWQLHASRIEARIPYLHGSRLKRFGGSLDQIKRVVELIVKEEKTSKAIALVVDPGRDFISDSPFASFCFVQFCLRPDKTLDCIGYYRAQEFKSWWPVNVAELRHLQLEVATQATVTPGKITTISPYPRLSKDHDSIRQPTKVAVPLIDQWVDNHPVRIAKIALTLTNNSAAKDPEGAIFWNRCLADLEQNANTKFHQDGVQVAIDGLKILLEWLEATAGPKDIVDLISGLLEVNELFDRGPKKSSDFKYWQKTVKEKLRCLRNIQGAPINVTA
jgi:hypothetical protein